MLPPADLAAAMTSEAYAVLDSCAWLLDQLERLAGWQAANRRVAMAALSTWRAEIRGKGRTTTTFDAIWRAAAAALNGLEFEHLIPSMAADFYADARVELETAERGAA